MVITYGLRTVLYVTGHGQCTGLEQCTCDDGWSSENCGTANCTGLNDCSNQGECVAPDSCYCYDGFDGSDCSQPQGEDLNAPVFNASDYYCTVSEKAKAGTSLLDVYATDADEGKNGAIHYELVPYGAEIVATSYLVIDSVSGHVTLLSPISRNLLTTDTLLVWVKAVDGGVPPKEAQAQLHIRVIDINDHCPEFHSPNPGSMHFVNMSSEINTTVVVIEVTDDDFGDNGEFRLSFAVSTASIVRDNFEVDATSGRISSLVSPLIVGSFPVVIVATDGASNPCSKQLSITIQVLPPDVEPPKPTTSPAPTTIEITTATSSPISANMSLDTNNVTYSTGYSMSSTLEHTTTRQTDGDRASTTTATPTTTTPTTTTTTTTGETRKSPSTAPTGTEETTPEKSSGDSEVAAYTDTSKSSYIIMGSVLGAVVLAGGLAVAVLVFKVVVMKAQIAKYAVKAGKPLSHGYTHSVRVSPMEVPVA